VSTGQFIVAGVAVAIGACLQGSVGFGFGIFAAPLLALVDRSLIPGPILVLATLLTVLIAVRDRAALDLRGVKWALAGRMPGTAIGVLAVALVTERTLVLVFCLIVLAAVTMSVSGWRVSPTTPALIVAGLASGVMGTVTSIGGPPIALVYQHTSGARLRGTLAGFFLVSATVSVAGLALAGRIGNSEIGSAGLLVVPMLVGFAVSARAARRLDAGSTRPAVLLLSAVSATFLLLRELL
jgi:uncharacterized protein